MLKPPPPGESCPRNPMPPKPQAGGLLVVLPLLIVLGLALLAGLMLFR